MDIPYHNSGPYGDWAIYFHTPSLLADDLFFKVDNVGQYRCNRHYVMDREEYYSYMLLTTVDGQGELRHRNRTYTLGRDQVLFINTYEWHSYYTAKGNDSWTMRWLHFDGQLAEKYLHHISLMAGPVIDVDRPEKFVDNLGRIIQLKADNYPYFEATVSSIITSLLNRLLNNISRVQGEADNFPAEINDAVNYIKANYADNIHISDIAEQVHLSQSHFMRLFKKATGFSPYEYLIKYRLTVSKYELSQNDKPVSDIARGVGFSNTNNFIATFKRYEQVTPKQFRKNQAGTVTGATIPAAAAAEDNSAAR